MMKKLVKKKTTLQFCPKCVHIDGDGCCSEWEQDYNNIYVCTSFIYDVEKFYGAS